MAAVDKLIRLLDDAAMLVANYGALNPFCSHETGTVFAAELQSLRHRVMQEDWSALGPLVLIFAPTGVWDDGIGVEGMDLANRVMTALDEMNWKQLIQSKPQ